MLYTFDRRKFLTTLATGALALRTGMAPANGNAVVLKPIPSTGERIPCVGLGTWITFNVGTDSALLDECAGVMAAFFSAGGKLIDSSPMYGSAQAVVGHGLKKSAYRDQLFSADKVWTSRSANGLPQIQDSLQRWGIERFDLLQVHNLVSWKEHLQTLKSMKEAGQVRYIGITTSEGRRHDEFEQIMRSEPLDFVQLSYNIVDREAEERLLPVAQERGIAVIANRPFQQGQLLRKLSRRPLPAWAAEIDATTWAQFVLKFIVSHPAITCAIPATSRVDHVGENMAAGRAPLPDASMRTRMAKYVESL